jgi:hypothetical protein
MPALVDDLRFATRTLVRHRGYGVVAVLTLALGISANAAIFSVLDAIVVQDLPIGMPTDSSASNGASARSS